MTTRALALEGFPESPEDVTGRELEAASDVPGYRPSGRPWINGRTVTGFCPSADGLSCAFTVLWPGCVMHVDEHRPQPGEVVTVMFGAPRAGQRPTGVRVQVTEATQYARGQGKWDLRISGVLL